MVHSFTFTLLFYQVKHNVMSAGEGAKNICKRALLASPVDVESSVFPVNLPTLSRPEYFDVHLIARVTCNITLMVG